MDILIYGISMMLIGLAVVFFMLVLLIGFIYLMSGVFKLVEKAKKGKAEAPKAPVEPAAPVAPAPVIPEAPEMEEVTDPQLIAVIAAAIAAFDDSGKSLVVRKVRRVNNWNKTARQEQVCRF